MKLQFSRQILETYSNIKFDENPYCGNELFHGDGRTNGQRDMTKLTVTFRNFSNTPENLVFYYLRDRNQDTILLSRYY